MSDGRPRLLIVSRLWPRPAKPNAAPFNVQQFRRLAQRYRVSLLVPVPFDEWIRYRSQPAKSGAKMPSSSPATKCGVLKVMRMPSMCG